MPLVLNGSTGITSANIADGTIVAGDLAANVARTNWGAGGVLQVKQTVKTNEFSYNSSAGVFGDVTGLSVSITPSSASSKILVFYTLVGSSSTNAGMHSKIQRNGTDIYLGDAATGETQASAPGFYANGGANEPSVVCAMYLDSPNTTSTLIYKIVLSGGGTTVYINRAVNTGNSFNPRTPSAITVMEIAG